MATYYVDNVGGSDSNDGLSTATAFASMNKFQSLTALADGDIIYVKYTGTNYTITEPTSKYYFYNGTVSKSVIIRGYATNTSRPKFILNTTLANVYFSNYILQDINISYSSSTLGSLKLGYIAAGSYTYGILKNCNFDMTFTGTISTTTVHLLSTGLTIFNNCVFTGTSNQQCSIALSSSSAAFFTKCIIKTFWHSTGTSNNLLIVQSAQVEFNKCIFYDFGSLRTGFTVSGNNYAFYINCVFILGTTFTKTDTFNILSSTQIYQKMYGCIVYNNSGSTVNLSASTYSETQPFILFGNNALYNITYTSYNTLTDPSGIMPYGINRAITTNPFLSIDPTSADFCKIDTTNTDAINSIIGKAFYDSNVDLGVYQTVSSGSGPLPNASDLRLGVVVGSVTGTLNLPSINDVRSGTSFDNGTKTGLLDLPSITDVKSGVTFDQATKTGSYDPITGNYTDVGEANVLKDATYKFAGVTKTGTLDLPSVNDVRSGTVFDNNTKTGLLNLPSISDVKNGVSFDQATKTGTLLSTDPGASNVKTGIDYYINSTLLHGTHTEATSTDPGVSNVRSGTNYTINNVNKTGTLDLPVETDVRSGVSYDNATKSGLIVIPSVNDVRQGTEYDLVSIPVEMKVGLLDLPPVNKVDLGTLFDQATKTGTLESTDPGVSNVLSGVTYKIKSVSKTGTKPFYALLDPSNVKYGIDRGDGTLGTDVGADFNDDLLEDKVQLGFAYKNLNVNKTGTLSGGAADYPTEDKVLYPTEYAFGTKTGQLGKFIDTNLDVANQIKSNAYIIIQNALGAEYKDLKYFKEVEKNDFYSNSKTFGIRCLEDTMTKDVIGQETVDLKFEIKITDDFQNRDGDDIERQVEQELITKMEEIRRQLRITKFGNFNNIRIVKDFNRAETEKIGDNIVLCSATITVSYTVK